jgi:peptide/nickel transport system substrate-binding protein
MKTRCVVLNLFSVLTALLGVAPPSFAEPTHGIAMHGAPALAADFSHLPYVNPCAPKGGVLRLSRSGSFDSLNPFIIKGISAAGIRGGGFSGVYESLLMRSADEPFTLYGALAEWVDLPDDRAWVEFGLHPKAKFSDGSPVTVEDVIFSHKTLTAYGRPNLQMHYRTVDRIENTGPGRIRFYFDGAATRETPLLIGLMPILSADFFRSTPFEKTSLKPPIGSGPYRVVETDPGRRIVYERNTDYWGRDLPFAVGLYNFDRIIFDYFRNETSRLEAFKSGLIDFSIETSAARWVNGYKGPRFENGDIIKMKRQHGRPSGMFAFAYNTRRAGFADARTRRALTLLFEFEWVNRNYFHGQFVRTQSFFDNSELAGAGPATPDELSLLTSVMSTADQSQYSIGFQAPLNRTPAETRQNRLRAIELLKDAGWRFSDQVLVDKDSGQPFEIEFLIASKEDERVALHLKRAMKRVGINASVRLADATQFQQRIRTFDFDMIPFFWPGTLSPGNEQGFRWSSEAAMSEGSWNLPGVQDPAIDQVIHLLTDAKTRRELIVTARVLDRLLLKGAYVLPLYHANAYNLAWRRHIRQPDRDPLVGYSLMSWWSDVSENPAQGN